MPNQECVATDDFVANEPGVSLFNIIMCYLQLLSTETEFMGLPFLVYR